jgi:CBS domain-containing protein
MLAGVEIPRDLEVGPDVVPVHVELDVHDTGRHAALAKAADAYAADDQAGASVLDAMTGELVLVGSGDPLADAVAAMREHAVDVAMVVDDRLLVGILTAQDVLRAVAVRADLRKMRVRHFMTAEPLTVAASTSAGAAVYLMTEYGVHHLPVMDGETPVGVITLGDAGRAARTHLGIGLGF